MSSFKGQFRYTIDSKGRVNIPARFRKSLAPEAKDTFVIIRGFDGCVFLYPLDEWARFEEKLRKLPANIERNRRYQRMILSEASEDSCDKQGRVTIPSELLRKTKIDKDVLILGILDRIELWNPDEYQQRIDDSGDSFESIAESIMFDD